MIRMIIFCSALLPIVSFANDLPTIPDGTMLHVVSVDWGANNGQKSKTEVRVCPVTFTALGGICRKKGGFLGSSTIVAPISPHKYIESICPGGELVSLTADYFHGKGGLSRGDYPAQIIITYAGNCTAN